MLLKQLSDEDARVFLCVAELLSLSDKPILWDGKQRNEIAAKDMGNAKISLKRSELQIKAMRELVAAVTGKEEVVPSLRDMMASKKSYSLVRFQIEEKLVHRLKSLPLESVDDPVVRVNVAREFLGQALQDQKVSALFAPKLMLFELMLFFLGDGGISAIQWNLLNEFSHHYQIDNYIVQDLLERAEVTHQEAQKTIAIIFE
jgi:hypothetical protein